jgi:localization factor PodJL
MNERARFNENGVPPDPRAPVQNSYYFPPASYPHGAQAHPQPQSFPQGYQQPGYPQPSPQQAYRQPSYAPGDPATFATIDDAVAEIAARQRALEGDPRPAMAPLNPGYGPDAYAPQYRAPAYAPPLSPYATPAYAEAPRYAPPPPPAPGPDLSGLEAHLRSITAQIETLRQPAPDFSGALRELRQDLSEIGARLTEALPRRAVEALEAEVRRLAERIDISRAAGVDADAIAGMERSLNELREAIRSLKPAESLAGFEQAIRNLSERIDHAAGAYQDPASLQQLEHSITALRGIVANVASNETLAGLAEEVRGLSARVERVASTSRGIDPEMLHSIEQRIANLPILGAIERGFADLQARLDSIQMPSPLPLAEPAPAVDYLKRDLVRTQDSLEAVHSTLGHLVDRLAMIEGGIREARIASETPAPPSPPAPNADLSQFMQAASNAMRPAAPAQAPASAPDSITPPLAAPSHSSVADIRAIAMDPAPAPSAIRVEAATQPAKPKAAPPPMRERQPIDSKLPHDFPLEPGTGVPRARPNASAAERIAASEAALGSAKPGGANHPGQTNFIAAARRAAQAAAAAAPEAPKETSRTAKAAKAAAGPVAAAIAAEPQDEKPAKSISQRMRSLFVGASAVILVIAGGKLVLDMFDIGSRPTADIPAPVFTEAPDEAEAPKPQIADKPASAPQSAPQIAPQVAPKAAPALPQAPNGFNAAPPSGVIVPERPKAQAPAAAPQADPDTTGLIGKRGVAPAEPAAAPVREAMPSLSDKLPAALRAAAAKGQPAAEYEVGTRFLDGKSVPQNAEEGVRWLERAAKSGIAPANFRLGGIYEKGLGVKKNVTLARRYYIAAAERGHAKSMHNLAVLYAEGIDGKPDYKTAAEWFRRASEFGVADSQYNLGILLARGIGIEQNLTESYKWFALAALQGDRDAAQKRDDVGAKLDSASLASARAAIQSFSAQPQPDDAISVQTPPGGWDRPAADNAPAKKPRAGSIARVNAS